MSTQGRARFGKARPSVSGCTCDERFTCGECLRVAAARAPLFGVLATAPAPHLLHAKHAERAGVATPCAAWHVNFGGGCLNCGWIPPAILSDTLTEGGSK